MKHFSKILFSIALLSLLVVGCKNKASSKYDPVNKDNIDTETGNFDFDGNFVKPEITIDGEDNDEAWSGEFVSDTLTIKNENNDVSIKLLRGESSLFFFYSVKDKYICAKGNDNGDDVSASDSVELYIDSLGDGGLAPQQDDYQFNLGVHDKTRILVGSGTFWSNWNGLCQYEVKIKGTLNNNSDIDTGYSIEGMIPWNQIGCEKNSVFAVAFGNVNKDTLDALEETHWAGLIFDGMLCEPQTPNNYIIYDGNSFHSRGVDVVPTTVTGTIVDENDLPVNHASVIVNDQTYYSDSNGVYSIPDVDSTSSLEMEVTYSGYKTHRYTIHSSDLILGKGSFTYNVKLVPGSGDDEIEPNYVYIGETTQKLFHTLELHSSRHDNLGLNIKLSINETKFDKYQKYEIYIDTGSADRTKSDNRLYCLAFSDGEVVQFSKDPKGTNTGISTLFVNASIGVNVFELYIPYQLLDITPNDVVGYSFGIWDTLVEDWEPMNRDGEYSLVENPSLYVRQNPDGTVIENNEGIAQDYDYSGDTRSYVDLGPFSGKNVSGITFSTVTAKVDHTDSEAVYVQFTTNQVKWKNEEIIELFIDAGDPTRTVRDGNSYMIGISTAKGKITQFKSYTSPETVLDKENLTIYMDSTHILAKIPYTALNGALTQSTVLGFTFGIFNNAAGDWDGYAYEDTYIDPEKPNLYVRVDMSNVIQ